MLTLKKKDNPIVAIGRVKMYMEDNDIDGIDDFVSEALGKKTKEIIKIASKYVEVES